MWNRIKGQVLRGREDKDEDPQNTIISRALLKFYAPEVPRWLSNVNPSGDTYQSSVSVSASAASSASTFSTQRSTDSRRTFDRSDRFRTASPVNHVEQKPADSKPRSGLASKLKNTHW